MNAVEVRNLNFNYEGAFVFENLNFNVKKGSFLTILGEGGSGKSTLFKIFSNKLKYGGKIIMFDRSINYNLRKGYLGLVSPSLYYFKEKKVIDELINVLKFKGTSFDKINSIVMRVSNKMRIMDILDQDLISLNIKQKILVMFTLQLLLRPKVLIIDNSFSYLDSEINFVIKEIKRFSKKCTIINISNEPEEYLLGNEVLFLGDNFIKKDINNLTSDDFVLHNLSVPFNIALCERLKFYGLISDLYFDMERLIDDLWN